MKNQPAEKRQPVVNEDKIEATGSLKILFSLEDNTIEDTSAPELDRTLVEFGY